MKENVTGNLNLLYGLRVIDGTGNMFYLKKQNKRGLIVIQCGDEMRSSFRCSLSFVIIM